MSRFIIMDPMLVSEGGGHYYTYDLRLIEEFQKRGVECVLFAHQTVNVPSINNVVAQPLFSPEHIFKEVSTDAKTWPIENFNIINSQFMNELLKIPTTYFQSSDIVYFPNILQNQLFGIALWLANFPADQRPIVVVMLRWLNHKMDYMVHREGVDLLPLYYRYAAKSLMATSSKVILCADTKELATEYAQMTVVPVLELPNPMDVNYFSSIKTRDPTARPVVLYLGGSTFLRGLQFLPEIIQAALMLPEQPFFIIRIGDETGEFKPYTDWLQQIPSSFAEIVKGHLGNDEYLEILNRADIVLLPYSPTFYGHGSSGPFTEASSMGKVTVVTAGTVPAREAIENQFGVAISPEWTGSSMAAALLEALENLNELSEKSKAAADAYRARHSAKGFVDELVLAVNKLS